MPTPVMGMVAQDSDKSEDAQSGRQSNQNCKSDAGSYMRRRDVTRVGAARNKAGEQGPFFGMVEVAAAVYVMVSLKGTSTADTTIVICNAGYITN